jgi:mono/diheme cytochrome c family protein
MRCGLMKRVEIIAVAIVLGAVVIGGAPSISAQTAGAVTFTKDIAPILQRSCQGCHRPDSVAPMSLLTYEDARPWARAIKERTSLRHRRGAMPPWFIEKEIGIQKFKDDISLSDAEIARIARWADSGAPRGDAADLPPARTFVENASWQIGTPDLIVTSPAVEMKSISPDYWGSLAGVPTGLTEDRYVAAMEIKEVNDSRNKTGRATVGGLFVFHHALINVSGPDGRPTGGAWPVHEVGRNADIFDTRAGKLLRAGSSISFPSVHLHSNGKDTSARLQIGLKFHPVGYKPEIQTTLISIGTGDLDIPGGATVNQSAYMTLSQPLKLTVFEPHMHSTGVRMCLEAIYGSHVETLNCSGYDHNWVKTYAYEEDASPLLPRGTILKVTGYFDNTAGNKNVVDPRNWSGLGHRSIDNMLVMIAQGVSLTEEQFAQEIARRRTALNLTEGQSTLGCPMCAFARVPVRPTLPPAGAGGPQPGAGGPQPGAGGPQPGAGGPQR